MRSTRRERGHAGHRACGARLLYTGTVTTTACKNSSATRFAALFPFALLIVAALFSAGCATTGGASDDPEPTVMDPLPEVAEEPEPMIPETAPVAEPESKEKEGEVPLAVAESEQADA